MTERDAPRVALDPHPLLVLAAFETDFPRPLGRLEVPREWAGLLGDGGERPIERDEARRAGVRDLLRHGGYKPTGRGKPSSEYLVRAAGEGLLASINAAVDACNAVSLASGLPISVVDLDRVAGALRVGVAEPGARYVFNPSGQEIDVSGLLCLFDGEGPCANAVKDAQRTKTDGATTRTLSLVWAPRGHEDALAAAERWYRELLESLGARTRPARLEPAP